MAHTHRVDQGHPSHACARLSLPKSRSCYILGDGRPLFVPRCTLLLSLLSPPGDRATACSDFPEGGVCETGTLLAQREAIASAPALTREGINTFESINLNLPCNLQGATKQQVAAFHGLVPVDGMRTYAYK